MKKRILKLYIKEAMRISKAVLISPLIMAKSLMAVGVMSREGINIVRRKRANGGYYECGSDCEKISIIIVELITIALSVGVIAVATMLAPKFFTITPAVWYCGAAVFYAATVCFYCFLSKGLREGESAFDCIGDCSILSTSSIGFLTLLVMGIIG